MLKFFRLSAAVAAATIGAGMQAHAAADSIPDGFTRPLHTGLGIDAGFSVLMPTNNYLDGNNIYQQRGGTVFTPVCAWNCASTPTAVKACSITVCTRV